MKLKSNKKFMLLSAIGIIMVVDAHSRMVLPTGIIETTFPYGSFFMPMFVFISGYFFSEKNIICCKNLLLFLWKQTKKLLLKYYAVNLVAILIVKYMQLKKNGHPYWFGCFDLKKFFVDVPLSTGWEIEILFPLWFMIALFFTISAYHILRFIITLIGIWNDWIIWAILIILGALSVHNGKLIADKWNSYFVGLYKICIFLQFYHFGNLYKKYLEERIRCKSCLFILIGSPVIVNTVILNFFESQINYGGLAIADGWFVSPFIPIITSYSGIIFYSTIADFFSEYTRLTDSKMINYISCHTMEIMILHLPFMNFLNWLIMHIAYFRRHFDYNTFMTSAWYKYVFYDLNNKPATGAGDILYFSVGLFGSLGVCVLFDRVKEYYKKIKILKIKH